MMMRMKMRTSLSPRRMRRRTKTSSDHLVVDVDLDYACDYDDCCVHLRAHLGFGYVADDYLDSDYVF